MSQRTDKRLLEVGLWFEENRLNCTDPEKRMAFCLRMSEMILWLLADYCEDMQELEGRKSTILLPLGMRFDEAVTAARHGDDAAFFRGRNGG